MCYIIYCLRGDPDYIKYFNYFILTGFQVLNRKLNHLKIAEFTAKLYAPFKTKEEDMRNAGKTAMLLVNCFTAFAAAKTEMMPSRNETNLQEKSTSSTLNIHNFTAANFA